MTRIKAFPCSRSDERIHVLPGQFDHKLAMTEHGKDVAAHLEGRGATTLLPSRAESDIRVAQQRFDQRVIALVWCQGDVC